jgi:hypothetical protein
LTDYLAGGANATCTVLDKTISGMVSNVPAVQVVPVEVAGNPGLEFDFGDDSLGGGTTIAFTITAPASNPISDASLVITGFVNEFEADFSDAVTLSNGSSLLATSMQQTTSTTFGTAVTSLTATNSLSVFGFAGLDSVTLQFSESPAAVPEPSSLALLGVGLSALQVVRRRKRP